jgi:hypothetical protein
MQAALTTSRTAAFTGRVAARPQVGAADACGARGARGRTARRSWI